MIDHKMVLILYLLSLFFPYSDNPSYFNTSKSDCAKTPDSSSGKGFFLFRRKNSTSKGSGSNNARGSGNDRNVVDSNLNSKQRGSLRSLLRSKSGSSNTMVSL